jgi:hypothetical protein
MACPPVMLPLRGLLLLRRVHTGTYDAPFPKILIKDLSWEGHDFAGAIADDGVWKKIKEIFTPSELAKLPLKTIGDVAKGLLSKWALSKAGLG